MPNLPAPDQEHVRASIDAGERATCIGGRAVRNLAAPPGDPDPWLCWRVRELHGVEIAEAASCAGYAVSLAGEIVQGGDIGIVLRALAVVEGLDPHAGDANARRLEAGRIALTARNAHTRASLLTAVDGLAAVRELGVIDESDADGALCHAPEGVRARVLIVTCPSTGRVYAHGVPPDCETASSARRWVMGLDRGAPSPDVET